MDMQEHLLRRGVRDVVRLLSVTEDVAVFPLYNLSGQLVGYQNYRPDATKKKTNDPREARYFTRVSEKTVWGLEYLNPLKPVLFVVEGIFDAVKLVELGFNAVAVLSNDPKAVGQMLWSLPYVTVALCDNDAAGLKLAEYCKTSRVLTTTKDMGELSFTETLALAENVLESL